MVRAGPTLVEAAEAAPGSVWNNGPPDHPPRWRSSEAVMVRRVATRFGWGVADQALSSLTNFALGVAVARSVSAEDFGAYAIAFSAYLVALNVTRHLSVQPIAIRYATADAPTWRSATGASMGLVVVLSVGMGIVFLAAGVLIGGV